MKPEPPPQYRIDYQALADSVHEADYKRHANRVADRFLAESDSLYRETTPFDVDLTGVPLGKAFFVFDVIQVLVPDEDVPKVGVYLYKEMRVSSACALSVKTDVKRPASSEFLMSHIFGKTEEVMGKSYDKGHFICHGAGGGGEMNLFPQLRSVNRGWCDEGKLYRKMESHVADNDGVWFFARPIYTDGTVCPAFLEYGILMPDRKIWWACFNNLPTEGMERCGYKGVKPAEGR